MTVGNLSMSTVELLADEVRSVINSFLSVKLSDFDIEQVEQATELLGSEG